ncbi:MAG: hypothetical protein JWO22_1815 [Frankiales bacterium]|nr:hypothetical protein [Frankiales bacterium]
MIPAPSHDAAAEEQRQLEHVRQDLAREVNSLPPGVVDNLVSQLV